MLSPAIIGNIKYVKIYEDIPQNNPGTIHLHPPNGYRVFAEIRILNLRLVSMFKLFICSRIQVIHKKPNIRSAFLWAQRDLNPQLTDYESATLTN